MFRRALTYLFAALLSTLSSWTSTAQVVEYKSHFPTEQFQEFRRLEADAFDISQDIELQIHKLSALGMEAVRYSSDLGIEYSTIALKKALYNNLDSLAAEIQTSIAIPHINLGQYEPAEKYLVSAMAFWQKQKINRKIALTHRHFAFLNSQRGDLPEALSRYQAAKKLQEEFEEIPQMWSLYNGLLSLYSRLGDYESAAEYGEEFINASKALEEPPRRLPLFYRNTAHCHLKLGNYEKADSFAREAMPGYLSRKIPKFKIDLFTLMFDIALAKNDLEMASSVADSSLKYTLQFQDPLALADANADKGKVLDLMGQHQEASTYFLDAKKFALKSNNKNIIMGTSKKLSKALAKLGNFSMAYENLLLSDSMDQIIYDENMSKEVRDLEVGEVRETSQKEIDLLSAQNKLKEENLVKEKRIRTFLIAGILLMTALIASVLFLLLQRSRHNRELSSKNRVISDALADNKILLKEVHHRVKNNLQVVASLLDLQSRYLEDDSALSAIRTCEARVQSISLLHQELYSHGNFVQISAQDYFENLTQNIFSTHETEKQKIEFQSDIDDLSIDVDVMMSLGLIANELICNSLKHAFRHKCTGQITLSLKQEQNHLTLIISDNGSGIHYTELPTKSSSLGIQLIRAFTKKLHADLKINNIGGTSYKFRIPHAASQAA